LPSSNNRFSGGKSSQWGLSPMATLWRLLNRSKPAIRMLLFFWEDKIGNAFHCGALAGTVRANKADNFTDVE